MGRWGVPALFLAGFVVLGGLLFRVVSTSEAKGLGDAGPSPALVRPSSGLGRASEGEMPEALRGVFLDMDEAQLRAVRPGAKRNEGADKDSYYVFDESHGAQGRALYLFSRHNHLLSRVQLAQQLSGVDALSPRIEQMQSEHGPVSGVWDCVAAPGQLPTRRFSWLRGPVGVMDVVLLLGERALATLSVSSRDELQTSLTSGACVPTSPEHFSEFPAVPEPQ